MGSPRLLEDYTKQNIFHLQLWSKSQLILNYEKGRTEERQAHCLESPWLLEDYVKETIFSIF